MGNRNKVTNFSNNRISKIKILNLNLNDKSWFLKIFHVRPVFQKSLELPERKALSL